MATRGDSVRPRYVTPGYSYAAPLERWLRRRGLEPVPAPPSMSLSLLEEGSAEAGMVPLGDLAAWAPVEPCPGPMVYSEYTTLSVAVVSAGYTRLSSCPAIAVTAETRTSILYLRAVLREKGLRTPLVPAETSRHRELLRIAPCALVIGDEALRAIASGLTVVADIGEAVRDTLGVKPVYAATAVPHSQGCPRRVANPPWPRASPRDVLETSRRTGLPLALSTLYHMELLRLDYNPQALWDALTLLAEEARKTPPWLKPAPATTPEG